MVMLSIIGQLDLADLHLLAVLAAQLATCVPVEHDVLPLPDEQRIAATLGLDALLQRQQLAARLQRDQALEGGVDLKGGRIGPVPVGRLVVDFVGHGVVGFPLRHSLPCGRTERLFLCGWACHRARRGQSPGSRLQGWLGARCE